VSTFRHPAPHPCSFLPSFSSSAARRALHSFPTRRSSDLAGAIARKFLQQRYGILVRGYLAQLGPIRAETLDWDTVARNPFFCPEIGRSTRLNSSHVKISYAVFCLKKKENRPPNPQRI